MVSETARKRKRNNRPIAASLAILDVGEKGTGGLAVSCCWGTLAPGRNSCDMKNNKIVFVIVDYQ